MASINPRLPRPTEIPSSDGIVSSSPAFGTPLHPILPSQRTKPVPAPALIKPTILPILLPPATLRPLAFRTFTKKHNLTLQSSALATLATFIGRHCGSEWREEGLAEKVLEEVAKSWKKQGGTVIVDGEGDMLKGILKFLEGSMSGGRIMAGKTASLGKQGSFKFGADVRESQDGEPHRPALESQSSFGISSLEVEDHEEEDEKAKDPREWVKVINAFEQPRLVYNIGKKTFERLDGIAKTPLYMMLTLCIKIEYKGVFVPITSAHDRSFSSAVQPYPPARATERRFSSAQLFCKFS